VGEGRAAGSAEVSGGGVFFGVSRVSESAGGVSE
jgi:hypothetical protein